MSQNTFDATKDPLIGNIQNEVPKAKSFKDIIFNLNSLNSKKQFYDLEDNFDTITYKKRENSKHEFGLELDLVVPKEGEVRLIGNKHRDCRYYSLGLELCKLRVLQTEHEDYLPCKNAIDSMFKCYSDSKYGEEYHKVESVAKPYALEFFDCYFKKSASLTECMYHFENSIRALYRAPNNKLIDYC